MKPGEKYIIEIDRVVKGPRDIAFVKGFNALVFDQYGLDHLERHDDKKVRKTIDNAVDTAYKRGWKDAYAALPSAQPAIDEAYKRGWNECAEKIQNIKDAAYQNGLDDAWKLVRRMCMSRGDGGMSARDLEEAFGHTALTPIFNECESYSKAFQKFKKWEQEKLEIHVGDEVEVCNGVDRFVVTNITDQPGCEVHYEGVRRDGRTARAPKRIVAKTGRHFDVSAFVGKESKDAD